MSRRTRRQNHIQVYLSEELYERILREAAVQRQSVSECARAALEELYAIRDELSRPLEPSAEDTPIGAQLGHRLLRHHEERMAGAFSRQLDEIRVLGEQLRRLVAMTDRQYVSLMLYLPDVGQADGEKRAASAQRRYQSWRRAVENALKPTERRR